MFSNWFGSKNKSASADDDLSQVSSNEKAPLTTTTISTIPKSLHKLNLDDFVGVRMLGETYSDKASTLLPLVSQRLQCHVTYPIVQVVSTMTFRNQNQKCVEGELLLPMPEGATLIGYAMEVEGSLIDAVPVAKEKAKQVFEEEVRAGRKVAMVEKVAQSNSFKTRLYPLPYNTDKTVQVKYQMILNETVQKNQNSQSGKVNGTAWVPLSFIDFSALRDDTKIEFTLNQTSLQGFETQVFMTVANDSSGLEDKLLWTSKSASARTGFFELKKSDLKDSMTGFKLHVSKQAEDVRDMLLASENGYFMASIPVPQLTDELRNRSRIGNNVQVIWDCSNSSKKLHEKNLKNLKFILEGLAPSAIYFTSFSSDIIESTEFNSVSAALKHIGGVFYDGGSNMLLLDKGVINKSADYCIAFTDGVHTFGFEISPLANFEKPIYFVTSGSVTNSHLLKHIATKSGGVYLNSNELSETELLKAIGKPVLSFAVADFEDCDMEEVYPNEPVSLKEGGVFKLFGKFKNSGKETVKVAVSFRFGSSVYHVQELDLPVNLEQCEAAILPLLWAQQKIDSLSTFPHLFKDEISKLGQDFRIVTDDTTLLVLETLDQYLKHNITPPTSLTNVYKQYTESKKSEQESEARREAEKIERIVHMWQERINWHKRDFVQKTSVAKEKECCDSFDSYGCDDDECEECEAPTMECAADFCCERECVISLDEECKQCEAEPEEECLKERKSEKKKKSKKSNKDKKEKESKSKPSNAVSGSINIKPWSPDAEYCKAISKASDPYKEYLKQRESYAESPAFYLDVADYFLSSVKNSKLGVRILSNIAELELENIQLYRIIGYRLDQADALELAEWVFERVKSLAPYEPQSYRDLALVKERLGKFEEAMHLFNKVITGKWDMRFDEIEMTVATEMNHLLLNDPNLPIVDKRFIHNFELDIRISMAWDVNDTDLDLHVQEPSEQGGEHAYYGHNRTSIGGYVSRDFRQGYGPEEYMIKKAPKGTYKATTNYYASHTQTLTGGCTILCTYFINYMRPNEQRQMSTIRLATHRQDIAVCDIVIQ